MSAKPGDALYIIDQTAESIGRGLYAVLYMLLCSLWLMILFILVGPPGIFTEMLRRALDDAGKPRNVPLFFIPSRAAYLAWEIFLAISILRIIGIGALI